MSKRQINKVIGTVAGVGSLIWAISSIKNDLEESAARQASGESKFQRRH